MTTHVPVRFVAKNMRVDLRLIAEMIAPGSRVLDIGCGEGFFAAEMKKNGNRVTGIDVLPEAAHTDVLEQYFSMDLDDPSRLVPKHHFGAESLHRAWLNTEGLPEYRTDSYKPLVDRWIEAVGKVPD